MIVLADKENVNAQYCLGRCYEYGRNNLKQARQWYIKAAENGNSDAMIKAAMFIAKRRGGGEKNPQMVMEYIQKAIAAGNPDGKALLASFYLEGRKDIEKGIMLAKESAELKSPLGQMISGEIYFRGAGSVKRDENKALEFFQLSSDQGNSMVNEVLEKMKKKQHADDR
ncbi:MAG: sel1 repeat family protein [Lentisphaeria bacterium]|nr:sel1 repeat family protein [Lentisphaeria bacterium]